MADTIHRIEGLHATTPQALSFAPGLSVRAFVLERPAGNVLVYNTAALDQDADLLTELGIERQYLSHWHEAMFGSERPARGAGASIHIAAADAAEARERGWTIDERFSGRHIVGHDLEVIPIPGHTPGATALLWNAHGHRLLFTGDTIYLKDGEWVAGLLASSDRDQFRGSLALLRDLDFDILIPWAASDDGPWSAPVAPGEGRRRIQALLDDLGSGSA